MKTLLILLLALAVILIVIAKIHPIGKKISLYIVLGLIALIMLVPFYMMFVMATHTTSEIYSFPPALWFGTNLVTNFHNMVAAVNFPLSFLNSCIVTFGNVILVLFFCSIGGYAFSVYQFPGKKVLFAILLGTMMVPWTAGYHPVVHHDVQTGLVKQLPGSDHSELCQRVWYLLDETVLPEQRTGISDRSSSDRRM